MIDVKDNLTNFCVPIQDAHIKNCAASVQTLYFLSPLCLKSPACKLPIQLQLLLISQLFSCFREDGYIKIFTDSNEKVIQLLFNCYILFNRYCVSDKRKISKVNTKILNILRRIIVMPFNINIFRTSEKIFIEENVGLETVVEYKLFFFKYSRRPLMHGYCPSRNFIRFFYFI